VLAFLLLPGIVAFGVPALLVGADRFDRLDPTGLILFLLILWGWAAGFQSRAHAFYALAVMAAFHLRVVFGEEPWLARTHGDAWTRYRADVPRWLGRRV